MISTGACILTNDIISLNSSLIYSCNDMSVCCNVDFISSDLTPLFLSSFES